MIGKTPKRFDHRTPPRARFDIWRTPSMFGLTLAGWSFRVGDPGMPPVKFWVSLDRPTAPGSWPVFRLERREGNPAAYPHMKLGWVRVDCRPSLAGYRRANRAA